MQHLKMALQPVERGLQYAETTLQCSEWLLQPSETSLQCSEQSLQSSETILQVAEQALQGAEGVLQSNLGGFLYGFERNLEGFLVVGLQIRKGESKIYKKRVSLHWNTSAP